MDTKGASAGPRDALVRQGLGYLFLVLIRTFKPARESISGGVLYHEAGKVYIHTCLFGSVDIARVVKIGPMDSKYKQQNHQQLEGSILPLSI